MKKLLNPTRLKSLLYMAGLIGLASTGPASAQGFADFLNNILEEFNEVRTPIATIALIIVGFAYAFNFVDLRKAAWAVVGIIIMFAATQLLALITGG